jgi:ketosteroid isomerase-like protein
MIRLPLCLLFGYLILEVVASGMASAEECSGAITAEEALRAEDARYAAQIANDFPAMERMFGDDLVYIRSIDGAVADKRAYMESMRSGTVRYRAMRRSDVRVRTYGCLATITGYFELGATVRGADLPEQVRFHSLWAKRGEGMQFVSWQSTRVPPKQ